MSGSTYLFGAAGFFFFGVMVHSCGYVSYECKWATNRAVCARVLVNTQICTGVSADRCKYVLVPVPVPVPVPVAVAAHVTIHALYGASS